MKEEQVILAEIIRDELSQLLKYKLDEMKVLKLKYVVLPFQDGKSVVLSADQSLSKALIAVSKAVQAEHLDTYTKEIYNETDTH